MSIRDLSARVFSDSLGTTGIVTSISLNMSIGELINQWLTVIISTLTIVYMAIKVFKELRRPNDEK